MAIPAIPAYPMPTEADLVTNRADWTPDPKRAVLLIHDMQQYFLNAFHPQQSPVVELLTNIQRLRSVCNSLGIPVIYSTQPSGQTAQQRGLLLDFWGQGIDEQPGEERIIEQLAPQEKDTVLTKWRYSAFKKTNLLERMHEQGRDQLIICGIYAHIGCMLTAAEAFMQDIQPFLIADAIADFSLEKHRMAITYVAERCGVTYTTKRLIDALNGEDGSPSMIKASLPVEHQLSIEGLRMQVAAMLQEEPDQIGDLENLIELWGLDSVRMMSLVEQFRQRGLEVSFVELAEKPTLAEWSSLLTTRRMQELPNADYFIV